MHTKEEESERPEAELLQRAREGDQAAIGRLIRRHQDMVYRFLLSRTQDEDLANDLAQETFLKALRSLDSFRGDASFRTWLIAIARNEFRAGYRQSVRRREQSLDDAFPLVDEAQDPAGDAVRTSEVARIRRRLAELPEKQRLSVSLRLFDGLSFREVGEATGSTEGAARVNFHHGIRRLREWLEDDEE